MRETNREEIFQEAVRVFRRTGYNDYVIVIQDGPESMFHHFIPFENITRIGKDRLTVKASNGRKMSFPFRDVLRIEVFEDGIGEEDE